MSSHQIIEGDVLDALRSLPDNSVQCCAIEEHNNIYNLYDSMCNDCDNAYFAGLIDGEATVYVKKSTYRLRNERYHDCINPSYQPKIKVKMVDNEALKRLKDRFGGTYYQERRIYPSANGFKSNKVLWSWEVSDNKAILVCNAILPFSLVKRRNLENLIKLDKLKKEASKKRASNGKFHGQPYKPEWITEFEECYRMSGVLNS